ncbi:MAG: GNAT family N-acetyltransferase [Chloroflexota bacterium]|nr:GNAT family N-acetyltransferase [Chloroflexota bacterium]
MTATPPALVLPAGCTLRAAVAGDGPAIRALVQAERLDPTQLRPAQFWLIEHGGEIIACGQLRRFPGAQELGSLVVAPAWRKQGLAAALIARLITGATEPLYLECQGQLAPFYRPFGFRAVTWRSLPRGLKLKFGLSRVFSTLFRQPLAQMRYQGSGARGQGSGS